MRRHDRRLNCQCADQPDSKGCDLPATGEDMLCGICRGGCSTWAYLGPQDAGLHLDDTGAISAALDLLDAADGL